MVLASSPESGRILSMGMSRFSGYSSGASTTGQRSWGKSAQQQTHNMVSRTPQAATSGGITVDYGTLQPVLSTSTKRLEEGVDLLLSHPTGSLLTKQQMGEQQVQHLYGDVLEATFLVPPEISVNVRAQEVWKLLLDELGRWDAETTWWVVRQLEDWLQEELPSHR